MERGIDEPSGAFGICGGKPAFWRYHWATVAGHSTQAPCSSLEAHSVRGLSEKWSELQEIPAYDLYAWPSVLFFQVLAIQVQWLTCSLAWNVCPKT